MTIQPTPAARALDELQTTVDALLDPPGCEWNRAQTHESLVTYLVEESAELVEAIEDGSRADLREELGDVLYQVVLHTAIARRAVDEPFDLADVMREVDAKIRRRHPHVFGVDGAEPETADGVDDIVRLWSQAKAVEKASRQSAFDGIPSGLPALARAQKVHSRAEGMTSPDQDAGEPMGTAGIADASTEEAWGRALLAEVDRAASLGIDAERALRTAVRERESALRLRERRPTEEKWRGAPQPE